MTGLKKSSILWFGYSLIMAMFVISMNSHASVVLGATRVIYNAGDKEVTLRLNNAGKLPGLVQVWFDDGNQNASPDEIDVPFIVSPTLLKIDPGKSQTLRIFGTNLSFLAQDKESVFWLNVLEVPPEAGTLEQTPNQINIAFRSRIKFFYRPAKLEGRSEETPAKMRWSLGQENGKTTLIGYNPTPYHFSFSGIDILCGSEKLEYPQGGMISPGEEKVLTLPSQASACRDARVIYRAINDHGGQLDGESPATVLP